METIGDKIKRLRKSKGLSLMDLAKLVEIPDSSRSKVEPGKTKKISDTALSKIETGKTTSITVDLGKSISKALDISFNELFEIEAAENKGQEEKLKMEIDRLNLIITTQYSIIEGQKEMIELSDERYRRYKQLYTELEIVFNFVSNELPKIAPGSDFNTVLDEMRKKAFIQIQNEKPEIPE